VNLLLLEAAELDADNRALVTGRRERHLRDVLRAEVGARLRAGVIDGPLGTAHLEALTADGARVQFTPERHPAPVDDVLLLAVPRPKVLLRMLAHAAALGFARVVLFRTWRVDKSWLTSTAMQPDAWREQLLLGLEQAGRTQLPTVRFFDRFKPMVEDQLDALRLPAHRYVAHPAAAAATATLAAPSRSSGFALAIGPDGGWLPYEVDQLRLRGFCPISCGPHPLRTETALAVLTGQLQLLRDRR